MTQQDGAASKATLDKLEELLENRRDLRDRRPGSAFEEAKGRGETPFQSESTALGSGDKVVVEDMIMARPYRGFWKADVDSSNLSEELKKQLLNMSNEDTFMRRLLDRREQSMKDRERSKVRQEEREKMLAEAKREVAEEVREEVKAEALVELKPELESVEVLKQRARYEVMAELQQERKGIDEERAAMERERERIREEQANVRREMMVNMINGGDLSAVGAPVGDGGVGVAERPAVVEAVGETSRGGGGGAVPGRGLEPLGNGVAKRPGKGADSGDGPEGEDHGEVGVFEDGAGFVALDEGEFDVYDGPEVDGSTDVGGGVNPGPVRAGDAGGLGLAEEPVVVIELVAVEPVVEPAEPVVSEPDGDAPKSREEWLALAGLEVPEALVDEGDAGRSGGARLDADSLEDYLSGRGGSAVDAGPASEEIGTREVGRMLEEDLSSGKMGTRGVQGYLVRRV